MMKRYDITIQVDTSKWSEADELRYAIIHFLRERAKSQPLPLLLVLPPSGNDEGIPTRITEVIHEK